MQYPEIKRLLDEASALALAGDCARAHRLVLAAVDLGASAHTLMYRMPRAARRALCLWCDARIATT